MSLKSLINNEKSDKDTVHSYVELYDEILKNKKHTATDVCEIGVLHGGSIKLWKDYFPRACVYGLDIKDNTNGWEGVIDPRIKILISQSAYSRRFINNVLANKKFDFILDDGPHTLESMKMAITGYLPLLKDDGIFMIEDVQDIRWIDDLIQTTPYEYRKYIWTYDRRFIKGRYDDIVFCINKSVPPDGLYLDN
jgi:hypothetical protein